jgi:uncharacterized protein (TIGR03435 family)
VAQKDDQHQAQQQEQLGLKVDRDKAPIEVLVIDHVQKPEPN